MARTLSKALLDVTALKYTWHMHANILINILSCATMLILIKRCANSLHSFKGLNKSMQLLYGFLRPQQ
jgi:hypothetical protein